MSETLNDFAIEKTADGYWDLVIDDDHFKTVASFDTALKMMLFCERRADPSEVGPPENRRGWAGNEILYGSLFENGSKFWLLMQSRILNTTVALAVDYLRQASRYLVEDGFLKEVNVSGVLIEEDLRDGIRIKIDFIAHNNAVESKYYDMWAATGT